MLVFTVVLVILAIVFQRYTLARGTDGVDYTYSPSVSTVEPDEPFEIITVLTNGTRRFIPFVEMNESLPPEAQVLTAGVNVSKNEYEHYLTPSGVYMRSRIYLMPRQKLTRRVRVSLAQRGRYYLSGANISIGDFLGLSETSKQFSRFCEIVVVPKPHPSAIAADMLGGFLGDISVRRFILEDPVLTLGFREYTAREPLKMISWTQSARKNELMVKKYDYTLEPSVSVILNVQHSGHENRTALIEACFSLARTVCDMLERHGIKYDFATNAFAAGALSTWSTIGEGLGQRHYMTILEGLGRATYDYMMPFGALITEAARRTQQGRSYIIITPDREDAPAHDLARLKDLTGGHICLVSAQEVGFWE